MSADALGGWADLDDVPGPDVDVDVDVNQLVVDPVTGEVDPRPAGDVTHALDVLAEAEEAAAAAGRSLGVAEDALADAAGVVRVAQAKVENLSHRGDEPEAAGWQQLAAAEEVEAAERRRRRAAAEVARLQDLLELRLDEAAQAREDLDDVRASVAMSGGTGAAGAAAGEETAPELYFGTLDEFVREVIAPTFRRKIDTRGASRWAPDWWRYPEAVLRLEALWRSWEYLRLDPATGMSVWLRDHADPHLTVLFSDYGPFARSETTSQLGDPLPCDTPPEGLFTDVR